MRSWTVCEYRTASCIASRIRPPEYSVVCVIGSGPLRPREISRCRLVSGRSREYPKLPGAVVDDESRCCAHDLGDHERNGQKLIEDIENREVPNEYGSA